MKRIVDPINILNVGNYIQKQTEEFKVIKNKLLSNILKISDFYQGQEANLIISKYQERINNLDVIIKNYENYASYIKNISTAYQNNINDYKSKLNRL